MSNEALTQTERYAMSVSYEALGSSVVLDLAFVKKYLVRGRAELVSDQELMFFMNTCKVQKLNPLVNGEVYLIKYSKEDPAQMVVGKGAYMRRAFEHPDYIGKEDGITVSRNGQYIMKEGCCIYPGEELIGGWCRVHYVRLGKERTAFKEVSLQEYNKGMANWKSRPATMINKVACSQCVRDAFPKDYEGLYSEDEMIASGAVPAIVPDNDEIATVVEDPAITQEQRQILFKTAREHMGKEEANRALRYLLELEGYESTAGLPFSVYRRILDGLNAIIQQDVEENGAVEGLFSEIRSEGGEESAE